MFKCPTCGQDLPEERLSEARAKAEAEFNRDKAERLTDISAQGKAAAGELAELQQQSAEAQAQVGALKAELETVDQQCRDLEQEISAISQQNDISNYQPYSDKLADIAALQLKIDDVRGSNGELIARAQNVITDIEGDLKALENTERDIDAAKKGKVRIQELLDQEKLLAAELEKLEGEWFLTEQFLKVQAKLIETAVASRFKFAEFKLFNPLINGGLEPCCDTLYKGVPYNDGLNNAARIAVGLDIISTLSEFYNFAPVVFIDNAEAICDIPKIKGQMINLYVSKQDKKLRVEVEGALRAGVA